MADALYTHRQGDAIPYGEWGCHNCGREDRDCGSLAAEPGALEHQAKTGHDVYVVQGQSYPLYAVPVPAVPAEIPGQLPLPEVPGA